MKILALDPGPKQTGFCTYEAKKDQLVGNVLDFGVEENELILERIKDFKHEILGVPVAIEWITSYGMQVGQEVFDTCLFAGRCFQQAKSNQMYPTLITRKEIKKELIGRLNVKDTHIRQALIELFGPTKEKAIGKKSCPGALYGVTSHAWSALAVAVVAMNKIKKELGGYFDY